MAVFDNALISRCRHECECGTTTVGGWGVASTVNTSLELCNSMMMMYIIVYLSSCLRFVSTYISYAFWAKSWRTWYIAIRFDKAYYAVDRDENGGNGIARAVRLSRRKDLWNNKIPLFNFGTEHSRAERKPRQINDDDGILLASLSLSQLAM